MVPSMSNFYNAKDIQILKGLEHTENHTLNGKDHPTTEDGV